MLASSKCLLSQPGHIFLLSLHYIFHSARYWPKLGRLRSACSLGDFLLSRLLCFHCWLKAFIFHTFDWDSFPFPNPLLGGWFVSRRLLLSQLHFYFVAPKSRSSFVANIRYIVYDCSSSIGQRCAGSIFAISNIGHHSAIVPLLALYRRSFCHSFCTCILLFYYDFTPQSCGHTLLYYGWIYLWWLASLSWGTYRTTLLICPRPIVGSIHFRS